ncbi:MAG: hypothetical protein QF548_09575, partial [Acidimicrobiales bacterium]|nr:hypothetical protein [Acidimicrobiales bacterium]
ASNLGSKPPAEAVVALVAVLLVVVGTVIGAVHVIAPLDLLGTAVEGANFTFVVGAAVLGVGAGFHHWGDDIVGPGARPGLFLLGGLALAFGVVLSGATDLISGLLNQNDFTGVTISAAGHPNSGVDALNLVSMLGSLAVVAGLAVWMIAGALHMATAQSASGATVQEKGAA